MKLRPGHPPITRLWRLLAGLWAAAAVLVATGYVAANTAATRRNEAVTRELAAMGLPTRLEEFAMPAASTEKTAVSEYWAAGDAIVASKVDSPSSSYSFFDAQSGRVPFPPQWWALADRSAQVHQAALRQAVDARELPVGTLGSRLAALNNPKVFFVHTVGWFHLWSALGDHFLRSHFLGNDSQAFVYLRTSLAISDTLRDQGHLEHHLAAFGCEAEALDNVFIAAARMSIGERPPSVSREQVRSLIGDLMLDSYREKFIRDIAYNASLESHETLREPIFNNVVLLGPMKRRVTSIIGEIHVPVIHALRYRSVAQQRPAVGRLAESLTRWLSRGVLVPADYRVLPGLHDRSLFRRRAAAIALGCALYRYDHGGAWPGGVTDLVPAYVPEWPADPLSFDEAPLEYRLADGGKRPVVIQSAGPAGPWTDAQLPEAPNYGKSRRGTPEVFDLDIFPRLRAFSPDR